jgi:hypothetical protein
MLTLADGTFFPPGCCAIPWGHASGPAGLAPEALQERGRSCKVFSRDLPVCEVLVSAGIGNIPAGLGSAMRTCLTYVCVRCISRRCSHASSPRAWARSRRSGCALRLVCTFPRRPSAGRRVRFPQLPSSGSRIADSSLSCYREIQVDAHAPFDKGWLVVRRLVHKKRSRGCARQGSVPFAGDRGRGSSPSMGSRD